jgi:hypothetical protein
VGMGSAVLMGIVFGPTMDGRVVEVRARAPQAAQALTLLPALMVEQALRGVVPQGHRALLNPQRPPNARGGAVTLGGKSELPRPVAQNIT